MFRTCNKRQYSSSFAVREICGRYANSTAYKIIPNYSLIHNYWPDRAAVIIIGRWNTGQLTINITPFSIGLHVCILVKRYNFACKRHKSAVIL